jgi:tetratricopeptide (TPR) repeat protein
MKPMVNGCWFWTAPTSHAMYKSGPLDKPDLSSILPASAIGTIIITSKSHEVACMLTGIESSTIEVHAMNDQDAFALLQKKFTFPVDEDEAGTLINALDHMPLALTQAAAYINRTPRMNIARYLEEISRDQTRLLDSGQVDIRRDATASNSITVTWQISFDYLQKRSPRATRLLFLMSLFDRQGIPKALLEGKYTAHEHGISDFDHDLYMLKSLCFVKSMENGGNFEMHGLVQLTTRQRMELNGELERWKNVYVSIINEHFPEGRPENWAVCESLFPHAQAALNNHPLDADALEAWASVSWKAGWYMSERGEFIKAYKLAVDSLEVRQILLDPDDPEIFDSLNSVGVALSRLGRYEEAKGMYQRAMKAQGRVFGVDHLDTLTSKLNIAQLFGSRGQWEDSGTLLQEVLGMVSKKETKPGRSLMLSTLTTLANAHRNLGRYKEAADLEVRILKSRESDLGSEHPTTVAVKGNLAYTYRHLGRFEEAEELNLQILSTQEKYHHAETEILTTKYHLASVYLLQDRTSLAETLHLEVLAAMKARLGSNHPDTLQATANLGRMYEKQGRLDEALALRL